MIRKLIPPGRLTILGNKVSSTYYLSIRLPYLQTYVTHHCYRIYSPNFPLILCTPSTSLHSGYKESTASSCEVAALMLSSVRVQCISINLSWMPLMRKADWKKSPLPESPVVLTRYRATVVMFLWPWLHSQGNTGRRQSFLLRQARYSSIPAMNQGWWITAGSGANDIQSQSVTLEFKSSIRKSRQS